MEPSWSDARAKLEERSELVLDVSRLLFVNGQSTEQTLKAAERAGRALGLEVRLLLRWGELTLVVDEGGAKSVSVAAADPASVNMARVAATVQTIEILEKRLIPLGGVTSTINAISQTPPSSTWLYAFAAGAGATALAVIFGVEHWTSAAVVFASAALGAALRRGLAHYGGNVFLQTFCAALLAGVAGALAFRGQLSSTLRLVAVCPCMVMVPGPAVLNGALDLTRDRIHLGAARLIYAALVILTISMGLLLGLSVFGVSLPVDQAPREVPLWLDTISAGIAVAAYGVFFSMPLQMFAWPVAVGMLAHALRWWSMSALGASAAAGALIACFAVGLVLAPVARRSDMPFAAIGFASVVSMIPGVFLFRMTSGLVQLAGGSHTTSKLLSATITDGIAACSIVLAMSFGLIVPKLIVDRLSEGSIRTTS